MKLEGLRNGFRIFIRGLGFKGFWFSSGLGDCLGGAPEEEVQSRAQVMA